MSTLSAQNRQMVAKALAANYAVLSFYNEMTGARVPQTTMDTIREMATVVQLPYQESNLTFKGDTLDRHPASCVGNLGEVVTAITLLYHEAAWPEQIDFLRSLDDQVSTKADIAVGHATYQVKTANFGTGGQLFVAEAELEGSATYMAYVDGRRRQLYTFTRESFRRSMKDVMDVGGPYDRWFNKNGWFITPRDVEFVDVLNIPIGVSTVYYSETSDLMHISDGIFL